MIKKNIFEQKGTYVCLYGQQEAKGWRGWFPFHIQAQQEAWQGIMNVVQVLEWRGKETVSGKPVSKGRKTAMWATVWVWDEAGQHFSHYSWLPIVYIYSYAKPRQPGIVELWWVQWQGPNTVIQWRRCVLQLGDFGKYLYREVGICVGILKAVRTLVRRGWRKEGWIYKCRL